MNFESASTWAARDVEDAEDAVAQGVTSLAVALVLLDDVEEWVVVRAEVLALAWLS